MVIIFILTFFDHIWKLFPMFLFLSQTKLMYFGCFTSHLFRLGSSIGDKEIIFVGRSVSGVGIFYASIISSTMFLFLQLNKKYGLCFLMDCASKSCFILESLMFLSYLFLACLACVGFRS